MSNATNSVRYKAVLLFGAPGSGKGTQGKALGQLPGLIHTSTGDMFRSLDRTSELGRIVTGYSSRGELVPDEITIQLWGQTMRDWRKAGKLNPASDVLIMDGIPRSVQQAKLLADQVDVLKVICLDVSDMDKMVQRLRGRALKEGRPDDADEKVIRNRLEVYERQTRPLLEFYPADKVAHVDALLTPVQVLARIAEVLGKQL